MLIFKKCQNTFKLQDTAIKLIPLYRFTRILNYRLKIMYLHPFPYEVCYILKIC
jgi:hypothetical protein